MRRFAVTIAAATFACGGSAATPDPQGAQPGPPPEAEAPVALNPDVPIAYPPALFEQKIEGEVVLRLFTDSTGRLIPESTRVAESSNYPALDSAALAGSARLRFAPAKRRGVAVATTFLQPVEFHHPGTTSTPGPPSLTPPPAPRPAVRVATPAPAAPAPAGTTTTTPTPTQRPAAPQGQGTQNPPSPALPPPTQPEPVPAPPPVIRPRPDTTRTPRDTTRARRDTTRVPVDTTRPPVDTTRSPADARAPAH